MTRTFLSFDANLTPGQASDARTQWLRAVAAAGYLLCAPGFAFLRQRSDFILGWQAAAATGSAVSDGAAAGATGRADVPPLGAWMMLPELTSPATQTVLPMNDCLYGAAHIELDRLGPVVISLPANPDGRYYSVTVMDGYFNNVAHLGPRWTGNDSQQHVIVPPGWSGTLPHEVGLIESPTPSAALLNRVLVEFHDGDADHVRAWRQGITLSQLSAWPDTTAIMDEVPVDDLVHPQLHNTTDPLDYFGVGMDHLRRNGVPTGATWLRDLAETARLDGEHDGIEAAAIRAGVMQAMETVDACLTTWPRINGWMVPDPQLGLVNSDILRSAAFQTFQLGANDMAEAAYFFGDADADGSPLDGSDGAAYTLRFDPDDLPQHDPAGFWSLTMYGAGDNLLVPNPISRYSTRPTRPGFQRDPDGGLTVVMASDLPVQVPDANWLPAANEPFRLGLRVYYPGPEITQHGWVPPAPTRLPLHP